MVGTRLSSSNQPSTPRQKNKIVATKALKSPDIAKAQVPAEEESIASSTASRPGLPRHIQKALAEKLEGEIGGIGNLKKNKNDQSVASLCNSDVDTFGRRGDPVRLQIQKYIYRWIKYHEEGSYAEKVLNRFGVKSAATRKKEARDSKKRESLKPEDISDDSSSLSSSSTTQAATKRKAKVESVPQVIQTASQKVEAKTRGKKKKVSEPVAEKQPTPDKKDPPKKSVRMAGRPSLDLPRGTRKSNSVAVRTISFSLLELILLSA